MAWYEKPKPQPKPGGEDRILWFLIFMACVMLAFGVGYTMGVTR